MRALGVAAALAVATAAAFAPLSANDFVNYDDDLYVTNNPEVRRGLTAEGVRWAFSSDHGANWFPLTRLSWMLDAELFGMDPRAYHGTSLALHLANTLLLFAALRSMTGALWRSALVAGVFGLHPVHVESVAWASARKDVLSGFFFMLVLLAWTRYARGRHPRLAYAAAALALALGLLAKQVLVTAPFALLLLDAWPLARLRDPASGGLDRRRLRRAVVEKLPLLLLALLAGALAARAQQSWGALQGLEVVPAALRLSNAVVAYGAYLADAFWPAGLAVFYPYAAPGPARVAAAAALLLGITAFSLAQRRRRPWLAVGWLFFVGSLLPVIGLVQVGQAARADRYLYLPLIGLALPFSWWLGEWSGRARGPAVAIGLASLAALGVATSAQLRSWRDSEALFAHALRVTERNHVAHLNLGLALLHARRLDGAGPHLEQAVRLAPSSPMAHGILGELRLRERRWQDAAESFRAALDSGRRDAARWRAGLGQALYEMGDTETAIASYRAALRARPGAAALHANLGLALAAEGRHGEAIASYREALRLDQTRAEVHGSLGISLAASGEGAAAREHFEQALALDPQLALVHGHLGRLLAAEGELEAALAELDEAVRLRPDAAELYLARAQLREAAGLEVEALADYREAQALGDESALLLNNLALLLATAPEPLPAEAVALAERAAAASRRRVPEILDTLAVAYAAAGRRADAEAAAEEALTQAERRGQGELAGRIRARLQAWRDAPR